MNYEMKLAKDTKKKTYKKKCNEKNTNEITMKKCSG
jgi:hypothetical protein